MSDERKQLEPPHQPEASVDEASGGVVDVAKPASRAGSRRRTVAIVLAAVLGALAVLCVGGLGYGYFVYRQVSEPDRSTPTIAVDQYLNATFVARDASRAKLFTCADPTSIGEVQGLLRDVKEKEGQFGVHISVSWEALKASTSGDVSTVNAVVRLNTTIDGNPQEEIQRWEFSVSHRSGWRVCDGRRIS